MNRTPPSHIASTLPDPLTSRTTSFAPPPYRTLPLPLMCASIRSLAVTFTSPLPEIRTTTRAAAIPLASTS